MEQFLNIIMYIMTAAGVLMTVCFFFSDIHFDDKRFVWYFYIPAAVINVILGTAAPGLLALCLFLTAAAEAGWAAILIAAAFLLCVAGNHIVHWIILHNNDDFSVPFFASLSMVSFFVIPYWLSLIIY